jgi:hypothetical protein
MLSFNGLNATQPYNATHMSPLPWFSFHLVTWKFGVAPWRECLFHNIFMFILSRNDIICWSKNGKNPIIPDPGARWGDTQKGFMKVAAAIGLLNLKSWSLAGLDSGGAEKISLQACVQHPYVLVISNAKVAKGEGLHSIACQGCNPYYLHLQP